ncbi:MAG: YfhO family protein [Lachnospiraceae bacterium]|nr:YfhO family protein [Lachnospiraceae bacterium]
MQKEHLSHDTTHIYVLSFFIPVAILIFIYILRGVYPFGDQCFLRSDMYHQYAPFLAEFQNKLKTGGSLTYSWNIGMGVNFSALYAYYLATPINWFLILFSQKYLIELMSIILILKVGLSGITFSHYICKHYSTTNPLVAGISVFYSLSAYICAYSWNVMWLDCIWLLPLVLLGLEYLVKENKGFLYCITLALCILSNYYISIMICIFCVLYFILQMVSHKKAWKSWFPKCLRFALYSLIAGGIGAFLLIPEYFALTLTVSGDINFPKNMSRYFSILEMISRQLMLVEPAIFSAHEPNIYSGVLIFLLVPLYALNPKVNIREKAGKFALIFFFYISFNLNILNYIWHGLHFPNSLPCRQSFIFNFLLLTMAYEALKDIRKYTYKDITKVLGLITILFLLIEHLMADDDYPYYIVYVSLLFVGLYTIAIALYRNQNFPKIASVFILFFLIIAEAFINTEETSINTTGRTSYVKDNPAITTVLNYAKENDPSFYRVEKLKRRTKNDSAWHHYPGVSIFSSTANAGFAKFLGGLGCEESTNSYSYYGATPLTEAILSVKYVLSNDLTEDNSLRSLYTWEDSVYLYKNQYTLPLGFLIPDTLEKKWSNTANNPFSVQNSFADLAANISPLFVPTEHEITGNTIDIYPEQEEHIYIYVTSDYEDFTATFTDSNGRQFKDPLTLSDVRNLYIMDLGVCPAGSHITFSASGKDSIHAYVYTLKENNFKELYNTLASRALEITTFKDTHIKGTITAQTDMLLFTSILYEKGWKIKIDGHPVPTQAFKDALISVPVPAGTHEIEFHYTPQGLIPGLIITIISLLLLTTIILVKTKHTKNQSTDHKSNFPPAALTDLTPPPTNPTITNPTTTNPTTTTTTPPTS